MAITKLPSGKHQVKIVGVDGRWVTKAFDSAKDAEVYETELKRQKQIGQQVTNQAKYVTFDEYFTQWFETRKTRATNGWRRAQLHFYRDHIRDILGPLKLAAVTPQHVAKVLNRLSQKELSEQTRLHIYSLMRNAFNDAIEIFHILHVNPVHKSFKPRLPKKEARFLGVEDLKRLLLHIEGSRYEIAIWLGAYMGLRIGEVQALRWEDIDFERQVLHVRQAYSRADNVMREVPKGGEQHSPRIPQELLIRLKRLERNPLTDLVAAPPGCKMLDPPVSGKLSRLTGTISLLGDPSKHGA